MECEKIEPADKTEEHLDEEKVCIGRNFLSSKEYVRLEELTNSSKNTCIDFIKEIPKHINSNKT